MTDKRAVTVGPHPDLPAKAAISLTATVSESHAYVDTMTMTWPEALAVYHALGDALMEQRAVMEDVPFVVLEHIREGRKILAIRDLRNARDMSLGDAKRIVDRLTDTAREWIG